MSGESLDELVWMSNRRGRLELANEILQMVITDQWRRIEGNLGVDRSPLLASIIDKCRKQATT